MSTVTRNQVMQVILSQLQSMTFPALQNGATQFITVSNKLKLWSTVDPSLQPAVFLVTHQEQDEYRNLGLVRRKLNLGLWIYLRADNTSGSVDLDSLMQAFESQFCIVDNPSTGSNTLGGMVYWVRIEGRVFKDPGDIDSQAMMIVPLIVEMP